MNSLAVPNYTCDASKDSIMEKKKKKKTSIFCGFRLEVQYFLLSDIFNRTTFSLNRIYAMVFVKQKPLNITLEGELGLT